MQGIPAHFPLETFRKYTGLALPRHVSYPMPTAWSEKGGADFAESLAHSAEEHPQRGLSLYLHLPFCETLCKFCACNKTILKRDVEGNEAKKRDYLEALLAELQTLSETKGMNRPVHQVHWGGGSPTYLEPSEIERIQNAIGKIFRVAPDAEIAMEIDPRHADEPHLSILAQLGFNRISMGIQDFDQGVQEHVHRIQPYEMVEDVVARARSHGLGHINFDLIYGLPYQSVESVCDMVEKAISLKPDRIAFYHYAQIPEKIATQRGMDYTRLPSSEEKLAMYLEALDLFGEAGYEFIGLDHFALAHDELSIAKSEGTLQRNFQGMATHGGLDLVGAGVSSISHLIGVGYWQNEKEIEPYQAAASAGSLPRTRGIHFSLDDRIRQEALADVYGYGRFDPHRIEQMFGIDCQEYFKAEYEALHELAEDGLVEFAPDGCVNATLPLGRILLRNIGAVFDAYLDPGAYKLGDKYYYSVSA
jgi:oxygen-independent coproporphyrinogen-3 oxidase